MSIITEKSIDVVIVTYGNRWSYLSQVINQLEFFRSINKVVIVNNGVSYEIQELLMKYNNVVLVSNNQNEGSAVGFHQGLKKALELKGKYIWILDDDNFPSINAIDNLERAMLTNVNKKAVYCSFRSDRIELKERGKQEFKRNSFFEFDIKDKLFNKMNKPVTKKNNCLIECESVPYGGLFLPKQIFEHIDLPNKRYYLYCDDIDFTYQITEKGFKIYCVTDSVINDLESSWYRKEEVPMFQGIFRTEEIKRGLYSIRNRVYFEKKYIADSKFLYYLNIMIYLLYVLLKYMPKDVKGIKRYFKIIKVINKGRKGVLGKEI